MKLVKKILIASLVFVLFITTHGGAITYAIEAAVAPNTTQLSNGYIKITVDNATGRFGIRTVDGQPIRKNDDNVNMLFRGDDPETSFTTFRIDGTDYIFGNPYKFGVNFFSETTKPRIVTNTNGTQQIETIWSIKGVQIKQILMLYSNSADLKNAGNVNVRYEVLNRSGAQVELGSRILLDTMVAGKDGPEFQNGTIYKSPLTVEHRLVHDPAAIGVPAEDIANNKIPAYWVMRDKLDYTNPLATNVIAYGFNNFSENATNIVDEMIVGHWNGLANTKWDYQVNRNLDFTRDTNDYGSADSAVAFYWLPEPLANGRTQSFETVYGLGEIIAPDKVFSIRYMDPVMQLATLDDASAYANEGIFDITAEIENLPSFNMEHTNMIIDMTLESGLSFVRVDELGNIVRNPDGSAQLENVRTKNITRQKTPTFEEAEQGIIPKYKPGDTITVTYKVQAKGRPWPTTKQYMLSVSSKETLKKLATEHPDAVKINKNEQGEDEAEPVDEGVMAQYQSSKANFILLPPIGEASATYVYGLSPDEAFATDEKYITLNMSNIEAYETGNDEADPNFDLYFEEIVTGARYKVPVKGSVLIQPTDDGSTGDMIITYRGGSLVDANGNEIEADLGPELPIGEYKVEIDYREDTGGNGSTDEEENEVVDAEIEKEKAALYDIVTAQTFLVTENDEARIRNANLLVIYKHLVDLSFVSSNMSEEDLEEINEIMYHKPFKPGADLYSAKLALVPAWAAMALKSRVIDPDHEVDDLFVDETNNDDVFGEFPIYNYRSFESEEEMEEFFEDRDELESLVTIQGMVREIGKDDKLQVIIDTSTEPAIINDAVNYQGKDLIFSRGNLEVFGAKYPDIPLLDTLFAKGDGTLSVAGSGFVFHRGEWTLDFYNGFQKSLPRAEEEDDEEEEEEEEEEDGDEEEENDNPEDDTLNGSLAWAQGAIGSRLNPMRQVMIEDVYFNRQSLFTVMPLSLGGFTFKFNDFILREGGISFGGGISFKVVDAEIKDVIFNSKGFVGVDASLKFELNKDMGLIKPDSKAEGVGGQIDITHYEQKVEGINNYYGLEFNAELSNMMEVGVEFALKKVDDGRILPDVIGFSSTLPKPGVLITGATYLTAIRGAIRELADTIAGGTKDDPFPLTLEAGVSLRFGIAPAYNFGDIDLTLKRTGIKIVGKLDFSTSPDGDDLMPMITEALLEAQWVTPWFVRVGAEVDVMGWDVIIGKAGIFVGQNLEKNRIDFEGFIGAKVQVPSSVPIVGGMPLSSVFFGVNNDKIWGSVGILFISLGITYYWGGGVEFGTSNEDLPDGLMHMILEDPEKGSQLMVIGQGIETVATSWLSPEQENQEIVYRELGNGVTMIDQGTMNVGIGGITTTNGGRTHQIPMTQVGGNALIEITYDQAELPKLTLKDGTGKPYQIIIDNDNTDPSANAFTQWIPAKQASDGVDSRKLYVIVPQQKATGTWTLTSETPVDSKLLSVPTLPELTSVDLEVDSNDSNKFNASWNVSNVEDGDTVSLYLSKDSVSTSEPGADSSEILEPGDPGLLIAKDLPVGTGGRGSHTIDVTKVQLLGDTEDIRGLLQQGDYYLRAELKSYAAFDTMTSTQKFEIIDPLAPNSVSDVRVEPAGNGMFSLSFKPSAKKQGHASYEHSYVIHAETMQDGKPAPYENFGELLFTESELASNWNASTGRYEGIMIGGWTEVSAGTDGEAKFTGLKTDNRYMVGVTSATKPPKSHDKNENYHFAEATASALTLLPEPVEPKLRLSSDTGFGPMMELLTNQTKQTVTIVSDQPNIEIEAKFDGQTIGSAALTNSGSGSRGTLSFDHFQADGIYAVELMARNTVTKDKRITILYVTVDTEAPVLYITEPQTGARTSSGTIRVAGRTSNDAVLTVGGVTIRPAEDGSFSGNVPVNSSEPNIALTFLAKDGAGNENSAIVNVTNDGFAVPVGLVLRSMTVAPGQEKAIEAGLRYPDGKSGDGKQLFKTVAIKGSELSKLEYRLMTGESVLLDEDGSALGLSTGASLVEVSYRVSEDVRLTSYLPIQVQEVEPTTLQSVSAYANLVNGQSGRTRVVVTDAGETLGYQLVYRLFSDGATPSKPAFGDDLANWTLLPEGGAIEAKSGDKIIVAKRTSLDKKAVSSSNAINALVWTPGGGFGPGGPGGPIGPIGPGKGEEGGEETVEPGSLSINGAQVEAQWIGDMLSAVIKSEHVKDNDGDLRIGSDNAKSTGYLIRVERDVVQTTAAIGKSVVIDLPGAKLTLSAEQLLKVQGDLDIAITPNGIEGIRDAGVIASSAQAKLLGKGAGVSIAINVNDDDWEGQGWSRVAIPNGVSLRELTSVMLVSADGNWTPVPWELVMVNGKAYADVALTGLGSLYFLSGTTEFSDVPDAFWGKAGIGEAASKLLVMGKGQGKFDPNGRVTRAEFPTMLLRAAGLMTQGSDASFPDVASGAWYYRSVGIASKLGLVTGMEDGSYAPAQTLTRLQGMAMIGRLLERYDAEGRPAEAEIASLLARYGDGSSVPEWARASVALAVKHGIIGGDSNGNLNTNGELSRAQAALIATRLQQWLTEQHGQ
ncbi:S-layer homology domain-containing protein [Paenibacillus sp. MY03]|uniref:S-layer homology domain-containing protein n=1 Tax=Paenibacillus sp. MY03 TaxID=302980 RepID=UPI001180617E|nr:S-layer homology domain-containing protein [Paenibacillus sp. MY03]